MANKIILKRSSVAGKTPTTANLSLGELGVNTTDGKAFLNKDGSSVEQFLITNTGTPITGSLTMTGSIELIDGTFSGSFVGDGSGLTSIPASALPSGILSSSAQIASDISGSFVEASSSFSTRVTTLEINDTTQDSRLSGLESVTGSFATTGSNQFNGNQQITGSLIVSHSSSPAGTFYGSGSTVFEVVGSQGVLWSINDSLSGSLFGVGDISGFQQFEVFSNGDVYTGDEANIQTLHRTAQINSTATATTESIVTFNSSSFDGAFIDYTAVSESNARAGNIMAIWNGSNVVYNETSTNDIGDTSGVSLNVELVGSTIDVRSVTVTGGWNIKATTRAI
jgi:hypothetical protein